MPRVWRLGALLCTSLSFLLDTYCHAWLPDSAAKLTYNFNQVSSVAFFGNETFPDHFVVLHQDGDTILLGGRNKIYNLSVHDFSERADFRINWPSSEAHGQLCILKGKTDDDCQNYIRILFYVSHNKLLICGTNSYKPLCRSYIFEGGTYFIKKEDEGIGVCPYNPEHNSTAVFVNGQIFSATVADFSGGDHLIYRKPQRTELSDLKQLNAPNFVSSFPHGEFIFFFYRETAVEYMNCGKIIYSRVARVCKNDKGGPHQSVDRWTTFLKARLNCSVPGEYPFYFDEIQSTSEVISGNYGKPSTQIIYGTLTTPHNAIGASAICAFRLEDILNAFEGNFKYQESINSNWLPVPENKVPSPRPGRCVHDSRVLQEKNVNFIKTHSLMEETVPAYFGKPILIRVNLYNRFTAIAVESQVNAVGGDTYDVLYVGTDDGRVLKIVNIVEESSAKAVIISENVVLANSAPVKQIKLASTYGKVIVVGRDEARLTTLNHCTAASKCSDCIEMQDPHCAWDMQQSLCVSTDSVTSFRFILQDVRHKNKTICKNNNVIDPTSFPKVTDDDFNDIDISNDIDSLEKPDKKLSADCNKLAENSINGCAVKERLVNDPKTLQVIIAVVCVVALALGFTAGFFFSRRFRNVPAYPNTAFIEQHNHLERLSANQNAFLTPRPNKTVNLVVNPPSISPVPKKENLDVGKDLNISSDGTLQKIKKTYI